MYACWSWPRFFPRIAWWAKARSSCHVWRSCNCTSNCCCSKLSTIKKTCSSQRKSPSSPWKTYEKKKTAMFRRQQLWDWKQKSEGMNLAKKHETRETFLEDVQAQLGCEGWWTWKTVLLWFSNQQVFVKTNMIYRKYWWKCIYLYIYIYISSWSTMDSPHTWCCHDGCYDCWYI